MAGWSAENATNAYLTAIKMGKRTKEPDTSEFISALVAGRNARLIVVACAAAADSTTLALVAAARQTGGKVICILVGAHQLQLSKETLQACNDVIKFVVGNAENLLLLSEYREADCIVVDCRISNYEEILRTAKDKDVAMVLGYNAFGVAAAGFEFDAHLLPIGDGLLVISRGRVEAAAANEKDRKRSHWVVKFDKFTGEEHVFRVLAHRHD